jgi:hypothetical protein
MTKSLPHNLIEIRREWAALSGYEPQASEATTARGSP